MIGHKSKRSKESTEYIRYYMCGNFHYKGSAVCPSNLIRADYAEQYVFSKLEDIANDDQLLRSVVENVNNRIKSIKEPIQHQYSTTLEELKKVQSNVNKYFQLFKTIQWSL
ncbi:zinc ribbon domain-containing protein [Brevibacillus laterosporus]|uniref:zinc ribbon domain-containing protein n=1 Tax=Brevibacillus laterosporus TaxID=1465 RepID=UPI0020C7B8D2|nr:zinc ribbon domain-containing protein [Brevibacillus laterosporus]